jgi:ribosomal protein S18 acetylase RimI-like enzyme
MTPGNAQATMDAIAFSTFDIPPDSMAMAVDRGLDLYNESVAPLSDVQPLAAFAAGPSGQVVGGAVGRSWGGCCELLQLWVDTEFRGSGIGSELLRKFEEHGKSRGCTVFYLTTLSYQAPDFYRRHGYRQLTEISGYPKGIRKYLMQKTGV